MGCVISAVVSFLRSCPTASQPQAPPRLRRKRSTTKTLYGRYNTATTGLASPLGPQPWYSSGWVFFDGKGKGQFRQVLRAGGAGPPVVETTWFDYEVTDEQSCQGFTHAMTRSIISGLGPGFPQPYVIDQRAEWASTTVSPTGDTAVYTTWRDDIPFEASGTGVRVCKNCAPANLYDIPPLSPVPEPPTE